MLAEQALAGHAQRAAQAAGALQKFCVRACVRERPQVTQRLSVEQCSLARTPSGHTKAVLVVFTHSDDAFKDGVERAGEANAPLLPPADERRLPSAGSEKTSGKKEGARQPADEGQPTTVYDNIRRNNGSRKRGRIRRGRADDKGREGGGAADTDDGAIKKRRRERGRGRREDTQESESPPREIPKRHTRACLRCEEQHGLTSYFVAQELLTALRQLVQTLPAPPARSEPAGLAQRQ